MVSNRAAQHKFKFIKFVLIFQVLFFLHTKRAPKSAQEV